MPPLTLPVAEIDPAVITLPPVTFPAADMKPVATTLVTLILGASTLPELVTDASVASPPVIVPVAEILPNVRRFPPSMLPVTDRPVKVPTLVIAGCDGVASVPTKVTPDTIPVAITLAVANVPATVRLLRVPSWVILVCVGVCITPLMRPAVTVPAVTVPEQLTDVSVPTAVMFGWLAAVTVAAATAKGGTKFSRY